MLVFILKVYLILHLINDIGVIYETQQTIERRIETPVFENRE